MKKQLLAGALVLAIAGGTFAAGCSSAPAKEDINANMPAGAPSLMPESHEGRFDRMGAPGCYGCHGANELANPMLNGAKIMPEDHYTGGSYDSMEFDAGHSQCNTCHAQG